MSYKASSADRNNEMDAVSNTEKDKLPISYKDFSLLHEIAVVCLISLAQLLTQAGLGQAMATAHLAGAEFGVSNPGELSWFIAAYSLTVGTFILPSGRWGDLFGSRKVFIFGYGWFALWSVIAGFSVYSNKVLFHFCRALQGIGPALLMPNGLALLGKTYPPGPRKNMAFSIFGSVAPGGFMCGAVFSSIFGELVWWPWAYWVMGMICTLLVMLCWIVIPQRYDGDVPHINKGLLAQLDIVGSTTGVVGLILFNIAWNQAPLVGWQTPYTYILLIISALFFASFFVNELRFTRYPLLPMDAISLNTSFVFAIVGAGWASFGIWVYYFWQMMQELRHHSPLVIAAQQSPTAVSGAVAAFVTGFLLGIWPPSYILFIAMIAFCVGNILLATMPVNQSYWAQTFVSMVIMPFGMDMSFPSSTIILSNSMSREHQGIAASLINTVVNYSVSLGLGFAGTVETHINNSGEDMLQGYRGAWYMAIGLSGGGIIVSSYYAIVTRKQK
ncbi:major facilitator superfamily-domain-containing protein [Lipomyces arxii]|uniref:major facilitator superfamily-domain-containing protein n=1 Tax=Lipomyces arxii TaxID=56418 RepID=UPI0034CEA459